MCGFEYSKQPTNIAKKKKADEMKQIAITNSGLDPRGSEKR